jgi:hypothetical protein
LNKSTHVSVGPKPPPGRRLPALTVKVCIGRISDPVGDGNVKHEGWVHSVPFYAEDRAFMRKQEASRPRRGLPK